MVQEWERSFSARDAGDPPQVKLGEDNLVKGNFIYLYKEARQLFGRSPLQKVTASSLKRIFQVLKNAILFPEKLSNLPHKLGIRLFYKEDYGLQVEVLAPEI